MNKFIVLFLLLIPIAADATPISPINPSGTTLPATCRTGSLFIDTDADTDGALYQCVDTDTWKIVSGAELLTLDDCTTSQMFVGGGAGSAPVCTANATVADTLGAAMSQGALANDSVIDDDIDLTSFTLADITFDVGSVDTTEFGYLNGVTSAIQTQIGTKVTGPGSSTDNAIAKWSSTGGYTLLDSSVIIDASNNITGAASITVDASATPTVTFNDSGGAGASKFAGKILMNMTTTTDDAETADIGIYAIYGGDVNDVGYLVAEYEGSAESWTFGDETIGEDLMFDFSTAGTVTITSPGGGTIVDFSALAINTTGITTGGSKTPLAGTAADFDNNFTGSYLYGGTYRVTTAGACALPEPAAGMNFTILHEVAGASTIESLTGGTADTIFMNGLSAGSDDDLTASAVGAMCVFQYQAANVWMATCNGFTEVAP